MKKWKKVLAIIISAFMLSGLLATTVFAGGPTPHYNIEYKKNTGTGSDYNVQYDRGDLATIDQCSFTKSGYTFSGWNTKDDGSGTSYQPGYQFNIYANLKLYAQWTDTECKIEYKKNGGAGTDYSVNYTIGTSATIDECIFTKSGYNFTGWNTKGNGTGDPYAPGYTFNITDDLKLYAQWELCATYTVTFKTSTGGTINGGTSDVIYNNVVNGTVMSAITPAAVADTGYTFDTWTPALPTTVTSDGTYTANFTINSYTMTFDSEGGSAVTAITQNYNTNISKPADPTKTGYTFAGWWDGDDGTGNEISFPYTITDDITVYAKWNINSYTMTFDSEGGSAVTAITQNYNTNISKPADPTKTGYTFAGWWDGDNGTGNQITFPYTITGDITVYAKWNINSYTMTFDSEGGSAVAPITQNYNTDIAKPTDPSMTGYTFAGWWDGDDGTGNQITFPYTITDDITVYAKWNINSYTMTFDSEGGSSVASITQNYNTDILKPADPTKTGYTFAGWWDGDDGTGNQITFPYTITDDITVYAKWTLNEYTVTFDAQNSTPNINVTGSIEAPVNAPTPAPTKTGYTFAGWFTGPNGSGTGLVANYVPTANITFYANWRLNVYNVTFDAQNGTDNIYVNGSIEAPVNAPVPEPTKTGYTFAGWFTETNGAGSALPVDYVPTANITFYANWIINTYDVTFKTSTGGTIGGDTVDIVVSNVTHGTDMSTITPTAVGDTGYHFVGWTPALPSEVTSAGTYTAIFAINTYDVTFITTTGGTINGDTENILVTDVPHGTLMSTIVPTVAADVGYHFTGWSPALPEAVTIGASYTATFEINTYDVSFLTTTGGTINGGTDEILITDVPHGTLMSTIAPTAAANYGYTFAGWNPALPETVTIGGSYTAEFIINQYTMMFDSAGGTNVTPITQNYNTQVNQPANPTRYGFTFSGWYTGENGTGTIINFPYTLIADITVHARWTAGTYTMSFDSEGGSAVPSISGNFGDYIAGAGTPTKAGYTFEGWYSGDNGTGTLIIFPYNLTGNVTVYAKWAAVEVVSEPSVPNAATTSSQPTTTISENQTPTDVPSMGSNSFAMTAITIGLFSMLSLAALAILYSKKRKASK